MAPTLDQVKVASEIGKNTFSLLRDALIFLLLILVATHADSVRQWMSANNVDKVNFGIFELSAAKQKTLIAAEAVVKTDTITKQALTELDKIAAGDPQLERKLTPVRQSLQSTSRSLDAAKGQLAGVIADQQTVLREAGGEPSALSGWMYLGTVDSRQTGWTGTDTTTRLAWPFSPGATTTIDDDAYLREDSGNNPHAGAPLIGVVRRGTRVRVEAKQVSDPLPNGLRAVWAKVTVQKS
jgi:hypothetical protein